MLGMLQMLLVLLLQGPGSALSCSWMEHKYQLYRDSSLTQLNAMVSLQSVFMWTLDGLQQFILPYHQVNSSVSFNSTEDADLEDVLTFPDELYSQASRAEVTALPLTFITVSAQS